MKKLHTVFGTIPQNYPHLLCFPHSPILLWYFHCLSNGNDNPIKDWKWKVRTDKSNWGVVTDRQTSRRNGRIFVEKVWISHTNRDEHIYWLLVVAAHCNGSKSATYLSTYRILTATPTGWYRRSRATPSICYLT